MLLQLAQQIAAAMVMVVVMPTGRLHGLLQLREVLLGLRKVARLQVLAQRAHIAGNTVGTAGGGIGAGSLQSTAGGALATQTQLLLQISQHLINNAKFTALAAAGTRRR